jgi:hypothetical protein
MDLCKCGHQMIHHEDFDGLGYCSMCSCEMFEPQEKSNPKGEISVDKP